MRGFVFGLVEDRSDASIGFDARQSTNDLDDVTVGDKPMLSCTIFRQFYFCVIAALPMQYQANDVVLTGHHDLPEYSSQDAFLVLR
jgi:hypothetical protein